MPSGSRFQMRAWTRATWTSPRVWRKRRRCCQTPGSSAVRRPQNRFDIAGRRRDHTAMDIQRLAIPDVIVLRPPKFEDHRGFLSETFRESWLADHGVDFRWLQENHS